MSTKAKFESTQRCVEVMNSVKVREKLNLSVPQQVFLKIFLLIIIIIIIIHYLILFSSGGFSETGCYLVTSKSKSEETVCGCNHLTHFAVLLDYNGSPGVMS